MSSKNKFIISGIIGAVAVILGAFGAHALKDVLADKSIETYKTGVQYHFYHAIVLLILAFLSTSTNAKSLNRSFTFLGLGIIFFSGSLYLLACQDVIGFKLNFLGPITPIGGLFFIVGWINIILFGLKLKT